MERKEIDFENLIEILHSVNSEDEKFTKGISEGEYDYGLHAKSLRKAISENSHPNFNLSNHIKIKAKDDDTEFFEEGGVSYNTQCVITIKNLIIKVDQKEFEINFFPAEKTYYPDIMKQAFGRFNTGTRLEFKNNKFIPIPNPINPFIKINLRIQDNITFTDNHFNKVNLYLDTNINGASFIIFKKNIFTNQKVFIQGKNVASNYMIRIHAKKRRLPRSKATIIDNNFSKLHINEPIDYLFQGVNKIDNISSEDIPSIVYWGRHQILDPDGDYPHTHKELFIKLKTEAINKHDRFQELILNREIIKCEIKLLKEEHSIWFFSQDGFVLLIGWIFSDHGTSWFRPLGWLIGVNSIIAFFAYYLTNFNSDFWHIFWELFNPLSNLNSNASEINDKYKSLFSFLNAFQKIFYIGMTYEIVKVFRRFIAK